MSDSNRAEIIVNVFGRTDVGRTREHNEDSFVVADLTTNVASLQPSVRTHRAGPKGTLFMVADGMGGAAAGEIASQMATEIVLRELRQNWMSLDNGTPEDFARALKKAAVAANTAIHSYASSHQEYRGMGTTATIAGLLDDTLYLCQIGDSRGYLVRDGVARQITKDQSLMQKLIEAGELTEEEAAQSERRNIILQALGPEASIKVDLTYQQLRRGDMLVLCSDGLSGQITRDDIAQVCTEEKDLVQACKRLIDLANDAGGPDNITVIVARFDGGGLSTAADEDEVGHRVFSLPEGGQMTPPMGFERIGEAPTAPMGSGSRSTVPVEEPVPGEGPTEPMDIPPSLLEGPTAPMGERSAQSETLDSFDTSALSPRRKSRGMAVAIALLVLAVAVAGWYAYQILRS
jgi:PPM family protein phosphatase